MTRHGETIWDDDTIARFRQLCEDPKLSYGDIARIMSDALGVRVTKNSCIGKARRLDMPMRKSPERERKSASEPMLRISKAKAWPVVLPAPAEPRSEERLTLLELERHSCRYPFGDRPPFWFCGRTSHNSTSYCEHHCGVVYGRTWGR